MDVKGFIDANNSYAYKQWESAGSHVAPWDYNEVLEVIQSSQFKKWQEYNPNGTIDQYYIYLCDRQAYLNSPEYKIECLESQIVTLNDEVTELKEEISEKDDKISYLKSLSSVTITTTFILMVISFVLFYLLRKRK